MVSSGNVSALQRVKTLYIMEWLKNHTSLLKLYCLRYTTECGHWKNFQIFGVVPLCYLFKNRIYLTHAHQALTSCIGKLMKKIINIRFTRYFRKSRSTTDALMKLNTDILRAYNRHEQLVYIFFFMRKACDTTWKFGILKALHKSGLRGRLISYIKNFRFLELFEIRLGILYLASTTKRKEFHRGVCWVVHFSLWQLMVSSQASRRMFTIHYDFMLYITSNYLNDAVESRFQNFH